MITKEQEALLKENKDMYKLSDILYSLDMSESMGFITKDHKEELITFYKK